MGASLRVRRARRIRQWIHRKWTREALRCTWLAPFPGERHDPPHRRVPPEACPRLSAEADFLQTADILATIPGVTRFEKLRQVSRKNDYTHGFSMEFADRAAYDGYDRHPDHASFVQERWIPEVAAFLEIDYTPL